MRKLLSGLPSATFVLRAGALGLLACLALGPGLLPSHSQDPSLKPTYGTVKLKAGFEPDPVVIKVDAGGKIKTDKGGVTAWVASEPDVRLNYEKGQFTLSFYVESAADTTLLINMPDGTTWKANDDGPNMGTNPLIVIPNPPSGQYDIWVGTFEPNADVGTPPAKLFITELKK